MGKGRDKKDEQGQCVPLTSAMRGALRTEAARTGVSAYKLVALHSDVLAPLTGGSLAHWIAGRVETVCPIKYRLVLETWRGLPDSAVFVDQAQDGRALLQSESARTGVGIRALLGGRDDLPEGLTVSRALNFYSGRQRTIRRDCFDYLVKLWAALPSREVLALTPEIVAILQGHIERTGKGPFAILRGAKNRPDGLTANVILYWLEGATEARKDHLEYVFGLYERPRELVPVPYELKVEIRRQMRRTGVRPEALLRAAGLTVSDGPTVWKDFPPRAMPEEQLQVLLDGWRELPDRRRLS